MLNDVFDKTEKVKRIQNAKKFATMLNPRDEKIYSDAIIGQTTSSNEKKYEN